MGKSPKEEKQKGQASEKELKVLESLVRDGPAQIAEISKAMSITESIAFSCLDLLATQSHFAKEAQQILEELSKVIQALQPQEATEANRLVAKTHSILGKMLTVNNEICSEVSNQDLFEQVLAKVAHFLNGAGQEGAEILGLEFIVAEADSKSIEKYFGDVNLDSSQSDIDALIAELEQLTNEERED